MSVSEHVAEALAAISADRQGWRGDSPEVMALWQAEFGWWSHGRLREAVVTFLRGDVRQPTIAAIHAADAKVRELNAYKRSEIEPLPERLDWHEEVGTRPRLGRGQDPSPPPGDQVYEMYLTWGSDAQRAFRIRYSHEWMRSTFQESLEALKHWCIERGLAQPSDYVRGDGSIARAMR